MFQSTHPHGVRQKETPILVPLPSQFQSTHPHGVRLVPLLAGHELIIVSIHAPARGATITDVILVTKEVVSIHAPARGATRK